MKTAVFRCTYQTLKGVCFFEAVTWRLLDIIQAKYQTLKGVCFFEAGLAAVAVAAGFRIPDAERRLLL